MAKQSPSFAGNRAVIYARYSTDMQSEASIQDQVRLCKEEAERCGLDVVKVYSDAKISGASKLRRPGLEALINDAVQWKFDVVISEALDRLSRDIEDTAHIYKRLKFRQIAILTLHEGLIDDMHIGFKGTMNSLFLQRAAEATKRGQRGRVEVGRIPGGLSYGYQKVMQLDADGLPLTGLREIDEKQAVIIRRIFKEYIGGSSARQIAKQLNAEGVSAPAGGAWNASTINGNRKRGNGILCNLLYRGQIVYNRQRFVKNPDTGKRISRLNPESEWTIKEVPDLRIIDEKTWSAAVAVNNKMRQVLPEYAKRPKRLLSGLLVCGACGSGYTMKGQNRYGCSAFREKGNCANNRSISAAILETRVLSGLKDRLLEPANVKTYLDIYAKERKKLWRQEETDRQQHHTRQSEIAQEKENLMKVILAGGNTPPEILLAKMKKLEQEESDIKHSIAVLDKVNNVVPLPSVTEQYKRTIDDLHAALAKTDDQSNREAINIIRSLVDHIKIIPGEKQRDFSLEIAGRLAGILSLAQSKDSEIFEFRKAVVAGARNTRFHKLGLITISC